MSAGISGIKVSDECMAAFDEIKKKKMHRWVTFTIKDKAFVGVESKGDRAADFNAFSATLNPENPCYAIFDFEWAQDGATRSKLIFVSWIPDTAKVQQKMIYASTKESLKSKIEGGLVEIQATDKSEIAIERIKERCMK